MPPYRVLFVDDEVNVTEGIKRALRKEPYEILTATSGEEALRLLEDEQVDVIISDEKMPGMSGSELLAVCRQKYPDTMRMILTGHASLDAAMRAINEGEIFRLILKPYSALELTAKIRQAIQRREKISEAMHLLEERRRQDLRAEDAAEGKGFRLVGEDASGELQSPRQI